MFDWRFLIFGRRAMPPALFNREPPIKNQKSDD
jgi:hypothetical protein